MPADRKPHKYRKQPHAESSASAAARPGPAHKVRPVEQRSAAALPGLNKIKGQIRQTKRLLAKDDLEPGLRVSTQRRLASLEADLANASKREVERKNGGKYHMVKFFERQKLLRLVKRSKKTLSNEDKSQKKRQRAQQDLDDARVMLNYVIHYPNTKKYIALFPSSSSASVPKSKTETPGGGEEQEEESPKLVLPPLLRSPLPDNADEPSKSRLKMLQELKKMMEDGKISTKPEEEVGKAGSVALGMTTTTTPAAAIAGIDVLDKKEKKEKVKVEEKDDFFDESDSE